MHDTYYIQLASILLIDTATLAVSSKEMEDHFEA